MKSLVYETPVNSAKELVARISAAAGEIRNTPEMLSNVRRSMKRRCEACITCDGHQGGRTLSPQLSRSPQSGIGGITYDIQYLIRA
ncbi:hypothetical protein TNCV_2786731 [Trichonephila clavipes]|nr:hypothetical protein TNCV_2786731 [Trichonephila clavipes]